MRLIATPNNSVNSVDRALWLTIPFDKSAKVATTPSCRIYVVGYDDRTFDVPTESRTINIPCDNRTYNVQYENRTVEIGYDNRTHKVTCE